MDNPPQHTLQQLALITQLETSLLNVWPSIDVEMIDGWAVRAAMGYSGRANSASALTPQSGLSDALLQRITSFFTARNLPTVFRTSPLCGPVFTNILKQEGFTSRGLAHTMIAELNGSSLPINPAVQMEYTPTKNWLIGDTSLQKEVSKRNPEALRAIVSRITVPVAFATIKSAGKEVGFGLAAIDNGWAEVSSIIINPQNTGQGLGRSLVTSLLGWAAQQGAANAYLQVDVTNTIALNLYRSLGFTVLYDYDTLRRDIP